MRRSLKVTSAVYDYQAKDFGTIAQRMGENFNKANKSHAIGEDAMNNLFRAGVFLIFDDEEGRKLGTELLNLTHSMAKQKAKDDLIDSTRYNVVQIPWDWEFINRLEDDWDQKPVVEKP
jgi:phage-related minor tail protein